MLFNNYPSQNFPYLSDEVTAKLYEQIYINTSINSNLANKKSTSAIELSGYVAKIICYNT